MSGVLNDKSDILLLGKFEACSNVVGRSDIDWVRSIVAHCAGWCLWSIWVTALEIWSHNGWRRRKASEVGQKRHLQFSKIKPYWTSGNGHSAWRREHSVALKVGSWQGAPKGTVAMSLPWTVAFSFAHSWGLGQQSSPGRQRHEDLLKPLESLARPALEKDRTNAHVTSASLRRQVIAANMLAGTYLCGIHVKHQGKCRRLNFYKPS